MTEKPSSSDDTSYLPDAEVAPEQDGDKTPASPAGSKDEPKTALEIVETVLDPKEEPEDGESSTPDEGNEDAEGGQTEAKTDDDAEGDEPAESEAEGKDQADEDAKLPFHKHPRWQEVQGQLKEARPKAEAFDKLQGHMKEIGLSPEEVEAGINLMSVLKHGDPAQALEKLKPYYESLTRTTGDALPDDLVKAIDEGQITEEYARQLAKARGAQEHSKVVQQRSQKTAAEANGQQVASAVTQWEQNWRSSDPDADKLIGMVKTGIEARVAKAHREGRTITPQVAVQMAEDARKDVQETTKKLMPSKRPAMDPKTITSESVPGITEPKSTLDAIDMAIQQQAAA